MNSVILSGERLGLGARVSSLGNNGFSARILGMKESLSKLVAEALSELFGIGEVSFVIEHPKDMSHGDYATNSALVVAKQLDKNPKEIAEQLVAYLNEHKGATIDTVSIAGPGFINFTLTRDVFVKGLQDAEGKEWGSTDVYADKKILVEHSSPNLFKPFHIGHLMNNTIGESITRLAKSSGAQVSTMSFPSDISLGVAKAISVSLRARLRGVYNVAGPQPLPLSVVVTEAGRTRIPLPEPSPLQRVPPRSSDARCRSRWSPPSVAPTRHSPSGTNAHTCSRTD